MLEDDMTAQVGQIGSGPRQCRRVILDEAQLIQTSDAAWLYGTQSGIVVKADTAAECLIEFFDALNSQIDFPEQYGLPDFASSDDNRQEYLSVMRLRMGEAIAPPPDPAGGWDQQVEFFEGRCEREHNPVNIPLIDHRKLSF